MPARRQVPHVTPAQRDLLRLVRFDPKGAAPSLADVVSLCRLGLLGHDDRGRLRLTEAGYRASRVMAVESPSLAAFSDHADDSGAVDSLGTTEPTVPALTMGGMILAALRGLRHPAPAPAPEFRGIVDAAVRS